MLRGLLKRVTPLLVGALAATPTAQAQQADPRTRILYVACYAFHIGESSSTYLPVVRATEWEVSNHLQSKVENSIAAGRPPGYRSECKTGDTPEAAQAARIKSGYVKTSEAPWPKDVVLASMSSPGSAAPAAPKPKPAPPASLPEPKPQPRSSAPALTVRADTSLRDAGKVWDEQVKKTLADEARKKVETAAKAAQADAKLKAEMEAFFAERRKRGRAQ